MFVDTVPVKPELPNSYRIIQYEGTHNLKYKSYKNTIKINIINHFTTFNASISVVKSDQLFTQNCIKHEYYVFDERKLSTPCYVFDEQALCIPCVFSNSRIRSYNCILRDGRSCPCFYPL